MRFLAAAIIAAIVASVLTPLVRYAASGLGSSSRHTDRDVHEGAIPRVGGVAIGLALFAPLLWLYLTDAGFAALCHANANWALGLGGGAVVMCALGFVDDVRSLRAVQKLLVQCAVAWGAFACGFRIDAIVLPFIGELSMGAMALPVTVLWIVAIVNAVNLIDGLDGLAAGVVCFAAITNLVVAYMSGGVVAALIMASLIGALLGFLFHNFNPARIFMGDSGSYLLGYILAVTALVGPTYKTSTAVSLLVPIVGLGVPIFDMLFTMVRRVLERRPLFAPDRGHVHHRLLDLGITHRRAVLILYGVSMLFTGAAIGIYVGRRWQIGVALAIVSALIIGLVRFLGLHRLTQRRATDTPDGELQPDEGMRRDILRRASGRGSRLA